MSPFTNESEDLNIRELAAKFSLKKEI